MRHLRTALPLMLVLASMARAEDTASAPAPADTATAATAEDLRFARNLSRAFRHLAKGLQPSVVSVRTPSTTLVQSPARIAALNAARAWGIRSSVGLVVAANRSAVSRLALSNAPPGRSARAARISARRFHCRRMKKRSKSSRGRTFSHSMMKAESPPSAKPRRWAS